MEEQALEIIVRAGNAKAILLEMLDGIGDEEYDFKKAEEKLEQAKAEMIAAHDIHFDMLQRFSAEGITELNILLIHAEDHLMAAQIIFDVAEKTVIQTQAIVKRMKKLEEKLK